MELQTHALAFGYRRQRVGSNLGLRVGPGEVLCLLGPNGCGKTTLFKTLLGLLPRHGGRIALDGEELRHLARAEIARRIAYVPQAHAAVFPYSVHDMVLMGRTAHRGLFSGPGHNDHAQAQEALALLGIGHLSGRDYSRISGGQRQLVLIARALAQQAPLIVMDEPTASLDFGNQMLLLALVRRLAARGLGVILSTHNPDHAFACGTDVLVLADGQTQAQGCPDATLTGALLSRVYGVPIEVRQLADGHRLCVPAQ